MELSERIKQYRRERGYSQEQVARKLHITQGAVSQWELGLTAPNAQQVGALADLLGTTADELLGREKPEPPNINDSSGIERQTPTLKAMRSNRTGRTK